MGKAVPADADLGVPRTLSLRPNDRTRIRPQTWIGLLVIVVATWVAYIPAIRAGYVWDDPAHFYGLPFQGTAVYLKWIWFRLGSTPQYYPLTHTTYWLEYHLWGFNPTGYHIVNILLHTANALLLWRVLRRLDVPAAWLAAALFALHPVHVESVAWVTERKNTLSGLFYLLAAGFALTAWNIAPPALGKGKDGARARRRAYAFCLACFVAAMLSKTVTTTFPAAVALVIWWKRGRITRRELLMLVPFVIVSLGLGLLTSAMEKLVVGAGGPEFVFSPAQHVLIAGRVLCFYAGKLLWPHPLIFIYPRWTIDAHALWQWLFPALAAMVLAALWSLRRRIGRGPLVAALFFAGTLVPALGIVPVYPMRFSFVADHFQYLASIGPLTLLACLLWRTRWETARVLIAAAVLTPFVALDFVHARAFKDGKTLWLETLRWNPGCWLAMTNMGGGATEEGRYDEAIGWFNRSIATHPKQPEAYLARAEALAAEGRWQEAFHDLDTVVEVNPELPSVRVQADAVRAKLLTRKGDLEEAARTYQKILMPNPLGLEQERLDYAMVLQRLNRPQLAIEQYQQALELDPDSVAARSALAALLARGGYVQEAMRYLQEALELKPDARLENNYGVLLIQSGRTEEAAEQFSKAIRTDPNFADAYDGLGYAREAQGRYAEAAELYRQAIQRKQNFKIAQDHLRQLQSRMH